MTCPRCGGLMAREYLFDFVEYDRGEAAKCLNCAFTTDAGFARNRARQREAAFAKLTHEITVARLFAGKGVAS